MQAAREKDSIPNFHIMMKNIKASKANFKIAF
jgi:hypothetical protein